MGCTAAKANTVAPVVDPQPGSLMPSTEENLSQTAPDTPQKAGIQAMANTTKGCAFEVILNDGKDDVIKKHPPKRIQRLEDQQLPPLTKELLKEKQEGAELRRTEMLAKRIQSAKARTLKKRRHLQPLDSADFLENLGKELSTVQL